MPNPDHVKVLLTGVDGWNRWRREEPNLGVVPDLSGIELQEQQWLEGADFRWTNLSGATLNSTILAKADLYKADLSGANLRGAFIPNSTLILTNLRKADLKGASLNASNLLEADLTDADLSGADLKLCGLVRCTMLRTNLTECKVYGASVWEADLTGAMQSDLIITPDGEPIITTDNLEVAQFLYLLLKNRTIRNVIDTITSKVVLVLGRFTPERKAVLDAIRDELRKRDYLPVLFDFEKPSSKTTLETVSTLAHMARFVVADITDAKSVLQELQAVVPSNPSVPIQPVILNSQTEPGMFDFFRMYPWVLEPFVYEDQDRLLAALADKLIGPAEAKAKEQAESRG